MKEQKRIYKLLVIFGIFVILMGVLYFGYRLYKEKNKLEVIFKSELEAEINTEVYMLSFIEKVQNGKILTKDSKIDTSNLGKTTLEIVVENKFGDVEKYTFDIMIKDTTSPVITAKKEISVFVGDKVDLLKNVTVADNSLEQIKATVEGIYDITKVGQYNLKYVAEDLSENKVEFNFILKVLVDPNNKTFTTSKGYLAKVINGVTYIDGILIANKSYSLPSSYGSGLTSELTTAFNKMKTQASTENLNLYIASGFRSYSNQKTIYNNYVSRDGKTAADTYSARAGHSEHQTGLAIDINQLTTSFANTNEGKWVAENCYKYGFIIRYPYNKENITGYIYEPWHLRYVGVDLATKLYNEGNWITLEEYFGIDSKYS